MILDDIVEKKKVRVENAKKIVAPEDMYKLALEASSLKDNRISFKEALKKEGLSVIGEFKKASPSKGVIRSNFNIEEILDIYTSLGIDAYSVLTEEDFFKGNNEYLKLIKSKSDTPILRKDFIIDFYQIHEAKVLGASAVLLIVAVLGDKLGEFYKECKKLNLDVLVEVHNKEELEIALKYDVDIIGINNRNLKNFVTTLDITEELIKDVPKEKVIVSESGIKDIDDLRKIAKMGADAVLVGEMFMRNIENEAFKNEFLKFKGEK